MPSWNIHTAHTEKLFEAYAPEELGISDTNAFLFGNYVPDIYLGYLVPADRLSKVLSYHETHFVEPRHIPIPSFADFAALYIREQPSDLALGAWAHLICDAVYNKRIVEFLEAHGIENSTQTRIRKQSDFETFGHTLGITQLPKANAELYEQCLHFEQYSIPPKDVDASLDAVHSIVGESIKNPLKNPDYQLLNSSYLEKTFECAHEALVYHLRAQQSM